MKPSKKLRANAFGHWAEKCAMLRLWCTGYHILEHRYRNPLGEIDLIAKRFSTILFIEVKARQTAEDALLALSPTQRARISRAAEAYIAQTRKYAGLNTRFDLMLVAPWKWPRHIKNAWQI